MPSLACISFDFLPFRYYPLTDNAGPVFKLHSGSSMGINGIYISPHNDLSTWLKEWALRPDEKTAAMR